MPIEMDFEFSQLEFLKTAHLCSFLTFLEMFSGMTGDEYIATSIVLLAVTSSCLVSCSFASWAFVIILSLLYLSCLLYGICHDIFSHTILFDRLVL
jgi:hypothetical protein